MELDEKIRYAFIALTLASAVLTALGLHAGAHLRFLEIGGGPDR